MILAIFGGGGLGREVLDNARAVNKISKKWNDIVFVDDVSDKTSINDATVYRFNSVVDRFGKEKENVEFVIAVGEPTVRQKLFDRVSNAGFEFATIIHPTAVVSDYASVASGVVICANAIISCNTQIFENVYIQPHGMVGHDSVVKSNSVISSNVILCGHCSVGANSFIGIGVNIKEGVSIGGSTIVSMGSAVFRDIPAGVIAVGNPARIAKNNEEHRVFNSPRQIE